MLTASSTLGLGIKVIGLAAIAAILSFAPLSMAIQSSYAQFGAQTQQEPQGGGEQQQIQSDGGLTATLNDDSFRRGDTIIIGGTVAEREGGSTVYARIYDPDSIEIDFRSIRVNTDGTFRQGFVAGEDSLNDGTSDPMTKSGTYTIALEYSPPDNTGTETTEVTFEYDAEAPPAEDEDDSDTIAAEGQTTAFQNVTEGFRIQVPNEWVADDADVSDFARQEFIATNGYEFLGALCPQEDSLPRIGGLYECPSIGADGVDIIAYNNLPTRPEFARIINQNQNITLNDLLALDIELVKSFLTNPDDVSRMSIEDQTETTVNVVDPVTNQVVQTLPAIEVVYGIPALFGDEIFVAYNVLLVLSDNGNTGYSIHNYYEEAIGVDDGMPTPVRQAFDSFELLTPSSRPNVTSSLSPQEQSQQQLVQSAGGLTARLNANNFTTGDTITVNGTVAERGPYAFVFVEVINPQGETAQRGEARVTADNKFTYSFVADEKVTYGRPMVISGNYLMSVQFGIDKVEFTFRYNASTNVTGATSSAAPSPAQEEPQQQQPSVSPFSQQQQSPQQEGGQSQSQPQQQPQQLQSPPQNPGDSVSIVPGSSSLTTDAYAPNPIQVSVGGTVTWTNDDTQPHTVNSGEDATPDGRFDSGIMAPAATFEHTFTEAGEYPYFCLLHPNQVGTVSVS